MRKVAYIYHVADGYLTLLQTPVEAFLYDWRHSGLGTAIHNALWQWVHRRDRWVRSG